MREQAIPQEPSEKIVPIGKIGRNRLPRGFPDRFLNPRNRFSVPMPKSSHETEETEKTEKHDQTAEQTEAERERDHIITLIGILTKYRLQQGIDSWLRGKDYGGTGTEEGKQTFQKKGNNKLRRAWFNSAGGFTQLVLESLKTEESEGILAGIRRAQQASLDAGRKAMFTRDVHRLEAIAYRTLHLLDEEGRAPRETPALENWFDHLEEYETHAQEAAQIAERPRVLLSEVRAAETGRFTARVLEIVEGVRKLSHQCSEPIVSFEQFQKLAQDVCDEEDDARRFSREQESLDALRKDADALEQVASEKKDPDRKRWAEEKARDASVRYDAATFVAPLKQEDVFDLVRSLQETARQFQDELKIVIEKTRIAALKENAETTAEAQACMEQEKGTIERNVHAVRDVAERILRSEVMQHEMRNTESAARIADKEYDAAWSVGAAETFEHDAIVAADRVRLEVQGIKRALQVHDRTILAKEAKGFNEQAEKAGDNTPVREAFRMKAQIAETALIFMETHRTQENLGKKSRKLRSSLRFTEEREVDAAKTRIALARRAAEVTRERERLFRTLTNAPHETYAYSQKEQEAMLVDIKTVEAQMKPPFRILPGHWMPEEDYTIQSKSGKRQYETGRKNKLTIAWFTVMFGHLDAFIQIHCKDAARARAWKERYKTLFAKVTNQDKNMIEDVQDVEMFAVDVVEYFRAQFKHPPAVSEKAIAA